MPTDRVTLSLIAIQAAVSGAAALVVLSAARRRSGRDRRGWTGVGCGLAMWTVGMGILAVRITAGATAGDSTALDGFIIAANAVMVLGVIVLPLAHARRVGSRRIDAAILTIALLSVVWALPFDFLFNAPAGGQVPVSNMVGEFGVLSLPSALFAVVVLSALVRRRPDPSGAVAPIVAAIVGFNVGDLLLTGATTRDAAALFGLAHLAHTCGCVLALVAALRLRTRHGDRAVTAASARTGERRNGPLHPVPMGTRVRPRFPEIATFIAVVSLALQELLIGVHTVVTVGLGLTLVVLSTVRMANLQREQRALHQQLRSSERQLRIANDTDALTGLGNRAALDDQLALTVTRAQRPGAPPVAVFFIDLDHFKRINDGLGHHVGDALLVDVAERLRAILGDSVFRIGGDEFVGMRDDLGRVEVEQMAAAICSILRMPVMIEGHELTVGASIGVALADPAIDRTSDGSRALPSVGDLLRRADLALYASKERHRGSWRAYDERLQQRADERLEIQQGLHRALGGEELKVHLRPVLDVASRSVCGAQAYLRWHSPRHGVLTPRDYLAVASEGGLLPQLDQLLFSELARALRTGAALEATGALPGFWIAARLSRAEVVHPGLGDELAEVIGRAAVRPDRLRIEVGEDVLADPVGREAIETIVSLGVGLTISSFGTGPAALMGLASTPASGLKLDRSFIEHLGRRDEDTVIVETVAQLANDLGLDLGAEGVTEPAQLERLARLGFDTVQGRFVGGALPMTEFFDGIVDARTIGAGA